MDVRDPSRILVTLAGIYFALGIIGASEAQSPSLVPTRLDRLLGLDAYMPVPEDNPLTREKIALGRRLFFERRLSRDGTRACASCHKPERAFTDGRPVAVSIRGQTGVRSAPTLVNRGYGRSQFWDGRARSLEVQVLEPIVNPKELDLTIARPRLPRTVSGDLRKRSQRAGPGARLGQLRADDSVRQYSARSLHERRARSVVAASTPGARHSRQRQLHRLSRGSHADRRAVSQYRRGLEGPLDLPPGQGRPEPSRGTTSAGQAGAFQDLGRFAVTGRPEDHGAFKTPTLREIARTAPYMHDGSFATLDEVLEFYNRGGTANPFRDRELRPLGLSEEEKQALLAFLHSLSGDIHEGVETMVVEVR